MREGGTGSLRIGSEGGGGGREEGEGGGRRPKRPSHPSWRKAGPPQGLALVTLLSLDMPGRPLQHSFMTGEIEG